jgi:hypothetical protein
VEQDGASSGNGEPEEEVDLMKLSEFMKTGVVTTAAGEKASDAFSG